MISEKPYTLESLTLFFKIPSSDYTKLALTPKSIKGGDEFKFFALLGDKVLDLILVEEIGQSGVLNSGKITQIISSLVNRRTLGFLVDYFNLIEIISDVNVSENDLKECIEALIGISYLHNQISVLRDIVRNIIDIINEKFTEIPDIIDVNYKGELQELLQSKGEMPLDYTTTRVGGTDHSPLFISTVNQYILGQYIKLSGPPATSKQTAERELAKVILKIIRST